MKITKRSVDALKPKSIISDDEIKGFVARRSGNGPVTYGFRYRPKCLSEEFLNHMNHL